MYVYFCIDSSFHKESNELYKPVMLSVDTMDVEFVLCPSGMYVSHKYYNTNMYIIYICITICK